MLYKLIFNYVRVKILHMILKQVMGSKFVKSKNMNAMNILSYGLEFLATLYLNGRGRKAK